MATIHLVDGEKGGVGKSQVTRVMVQYCLDRKIPFIAVETDRSNPDVANIYKGLCKYAIFSEDERQADLADPIFDWAMSQPVIVSLPSQVHRAVKKWIDNNDLIELGHKHGVKFCKWFVCNGEYDSVNLFVQSLNSYDPRMTQILVKNLGLCEDWEQVDEDETVQKAIKKSKAKVINFPKLPYRERYTLNKERLTFEQARTYEGFSVMAQQRIANFLKSAYAVFDSTGVWNE